jgi:DNA polymerase-4
MPRHIIHVDMDEFFAAVEKLDRPELRGKPLLIGGSATARGVVSTASYEARPFGCHSAMPMAQAIRLCPQAIVLPVRGERYRQASDEVFAILGRFSPLVEPLSIDEAFLDVTGCERLLGPAERIAADLKGTIREETGLTASLGLAPNKYLAKLASDLEKPDGLVVLTEENAQRVLDPLPVSRIWGVGPAGAKALEALGVRTILQLRALPGKLLKQKFGQWGEHCWRLARGEDDRPVTPDSQAKSIGQEETFPQDVGEIEFLRAVLMEQVQEVARRLRRSGLKARTATLKIRYGDFTTLTRSGTVAEATDVTDVLWRAAEAILLAWAAKDFRPLRLLGMTASGLQGQRGTQLSLFADAGQVKQEAIDRTLDKIAARFGVGAVQRALGRRGKDDGTGRHGPGS